VGRPRRERFMTRNTVVSESWKISKTLRIPAHTYLYYIPVDFFLAFERRRRFVNLCANRVGKRRDTRALLLYVCRDDGAVYGALKYYILLMSRLVINIFNMSADAIRLTEFLFYIYVCVYVPTLHQYIVRVITILYFVVTHQLSIALYLYIANLLHKTLLPKFGDLRRECYGFRVIYRKCASLLIHGQTTHYNKLGNSFIEKSCIRTNF